MTKKLLTLAALAVVLTSAFAGSAKADRWHDHEVRAHHYWHPHPHGPVVVEQAPAVYAPPVVYAPPPEPVSTGINLVLPLHFH